MAVHRYQPNRLGLFNFWYHTDSVFEFADGKLFVRGANGSGKSVTTTMAVPILLDGDKSPSRLDPFGGKSRLMVDLLLGEKNISQKEEATGYLYFEFKKGDSYLTIGIGMNGKRKERSIDYWYFVINDGRRVGHDFFLYSEENVRGEIKKFPLTKRQAEEEIGRGGEFTASQARYTEMVNQYLFGFDSVKTFKELIHILIQLRSPKLSRDTKPTDVSNLLSDSLPELADEDLSPMIQTIGTIDAHQEKLKRLEHSLRYLQALQSAYQTYNEHRLYEISKENIVVEKQLHRSIQTLENDQKQFEKNEDEHADLLELLARLETEKQALDVEEEHLRGHKVFGLRKQQAQYEEEFEQVEKNIKTLEDQYNTKSMKLDSVIRDQKQNAYEKEKTKNDITEIADELTELAKQTFFSAHDQFLSHLEKNSDGELVIFRRNWEEELQAYQKVLSTIRNLVREVETCRLREKDAEEAVDRAEQQLEAVKQKRMELQKTAEHVRENLGRDLEIWQTHAQVFVFEEKSKQQLIGFFVSFLYEEIEEASREIEFRCSEQKQMLEKPIVQEIEGHRFAIKHENSQQAIWRKLIEELQNQPEIEPAYSGDEQSRRNALREKGILFRSFYEAVDFRPEVDEQTRSNIEAAILKSGLLTALLVSEEDEDRVFEMLPIVRTQQIKTRNLTQYLVAIPNEALSQSRIESLLQGISISRSDDSFILHTGEFQNGFIHGSAPIQEDRLIGKTAREVIRAKRILSLQAEIQSSQKRVEEAGDRVSFLQNQMRRLNADLLNFPSLEPMKKVEKQRSKLDTEEIMANDQVEQQEANLQSLKKKNLPIINEFLSKSAPYHRIERTSAAYQNALDELSEYSKQLGTFFHLISHRKILTEKAYDTSNRIYDLENELDALQEHKVDAYRDIKTKTAKLDTILNLISTQDDEQNILVRIGEVVLKKKENEAAREKGIQRRADLRSAITGLKNQIETQGSVILELEELKQAWESLFQEEKSFGFTDPHWMTRVAVHNLELKHKELKGSDVQGALDRAIYDAERELMGQDMKQIRHTLKIRSMGKGREWELLQQWTGRQFITFMPSYIEIKPIQLLAELQATRDETALAIQEKERELYEKVLIDDIGSTIRGLIEKAKAWEEKANYFLSNIDTTVRMRLKWKPLPAKEQGELSTDKLVELLSKNTKWLNNHDLERIAEHFKTKVEQARAMAKEDTRFSLTVKMKELLDYRKWYRFVLEYKKDGQAEFDEFTIKVFEALSGGEKGICMYSPLFAAAAAKYAHAAPDSPRLFSLDEAFAGIDHENIENIFGLISQFDFDYLMNSQILWGTYETVRELSIVEILRRVHEKTLALGRYYWDGENKHDLSNGHFIEEYFWGKHSRDFAAATSEPPQV
ncbi:TIGR02680 family protein [Paenibacillus sp. MBLB4367]|uniref:TIGR02680 family protein n=1 Tax=Paenibacillus sp. MBLB4367 TaxID=3384767 RepID=UPI0039080CBC